MRNASLVLSCVMVAVNLFVLAVMIYRHVFLSKPFLPVISDGKEVDKSRTCFGIMLLFLDVPYFIWDTVLCAFANGGIIFSTKEEQVALLVLVLICLFFFFLFFFTDFLLRKHGKESIFFKWDRINSFVYFVFSTVIVSACYFPALIVSICLN